MVAFIHREEYYDRDNEDVKGKAEIIIAKQRNGPTGTMQLAYLAITRDLRIWRARGVLEEMSGAATSWRVYRSWQESTSGFDRWSTRTLPAHEGADRKGGSDELIEVSEERLAGNYRAIQAAAGAAAGAETVVLAVVKANAYGHGAERCAVALARAGARWFGVADAGEGARVSRALDAAGFAGAEILVMCGLMPEDVAAIVEHGLTPVVWTKEQVEWLAGLRRARDPGMARGACRD